jgi:hypothetical protein
MHDFIRTSANHETGFITNSFASVFSTIAMWFVAFTTSMNARIVYVLDYQCGPHEYSIFHHPDHALVTYPYLRTDRRNLFHYFLCNHSCFEVLFVHESQVYQWGHTPGLSSD